MSDLKVTHFLKNLIKIDTKSPKSHKRLILYRYRDDFREILKLYLLSIVVNIRTIVFNIYT